MKPEKETGGPRPATQAETQKFKDLAEKIPPAERNNNIPLIWRAATRKQGRPEAERLKRLATISAIKGNSDTGEPSGNSGKEEGKK